MMPRFMVLVEDIEVCTAYAQQFLCNLLALGDYVTSRSVGLSN